MASANTDMPDQSISCQTHDYIEIACMYGYRIKLWLKDGVTFKGKALTTKTTADKKEYLILQQSDEQQQIELGQIKSMQALSNNPHFQQVDF